MKHLLIAASILAMTAGVASAEITFSGSAAAGVAKNGENNTTLNSNAANDGSFHTYSSFTLNVAASGQTDSGLSFGASSGITAGRSYALADDDGFDAGSASLDDAEIWVSGDFGKLSFNTDGYDFFDDTNTDGDVKYEGNFGGFGVGLIADVDTSNYSAKVDYTVAGVALSANADTYDLWNVSAAYTMGAITVTAATDESSDSSLAVAYAANGISASAKYHSQGGAVDVAVGYTSGAMSINANSDDVAGDNKWTVTGGYDLGGGMSLEAGTNYTGDVMVGAKMSF